MRRPIRGRASDLLSRPGPSPLGTPGHPASSVGSADRHRVPVRRRGGPTVLRPLQQRSVPWHHDKRRVARQRLTAEAVKRLQAGADLEGLRDPDPPGQAGKVECHTVVGPEPGRGQARRGLQFPLPNYRCRRAQLSPPGLERPAARSRRRRPIRRRPQRALINPGDWWPNRRAQRQAE